ncbi:MAG: hypothetical protein HYU34_00445 [Candidatus Omnitrophica bacterium]|nr:hypothetical protein [Candidatus Omnitrophota bacterium]
MKPLRRAAVGFCLFGMSLLFLVGLPLAFAKGKGEGRGRSSGMPAGFSHGEKKGWGESGHPPGWEKGEKKGWGGESVPPGLWKEKGKKGGKAKKEVL